MKHTRWILVILIGVLLLPALAFAGGKGEAPAGGAAGAAPKVRFIMMGLNNPYTSAQAKYTKEWAEKLGWDYVLYDGELDAKKNAEYLDYAITENPDLIILMPIDSTAVANGIKKAFDAKIPVMMEHMQANKDDEKYTMVYTGPGNYMQGQVAAEMFNDKLKGKGNIVEVTCVPGQETTIGRHQGCVDRLEELGGGVKIIASNNGDAQVDLTLQVMEDFLTRFGAAGIQGIYCCDDTMAVAATIALKEAGIPEGSIPIIGVGGSRQGLASIKKGSMYGTIAQSPKLTQIQTKDIALKILKEGLKPPYQFDPYYQYVPAPKVTAANVDEFMPGDW
jgi:ribose transport system substrate-binding protein